MTGQQLKNSILQMAIQGKLVPQDPHDEPASVLLERIREEKKRLVKEGVLKKKDLEETPISEEEKPFDIPESWVWCRMNSVVDVRDGTHDTPSYVVKGYPLITGKDFYKGYFDLSKTQYISDRDYIEICKRSKVDVGDILFSMIGGNIGSQILITEKNYFEMAIKNVALFKQYSIKGTEEKYLSYFLNARTQHLKTISLGGAQSFVSLNQLRLYLFPLPPLSEQRRIVKKLESLMPLIESYGKSQEALNALNASLPEKLRQSILQEAIQGHLVPQDPNEEPASVLLERIRAEKARLVKEGKLKKKDLEEKPISPDEIPFDIPEGWVWVRWGNISLSIQYGYNAPAEPTGDIKMVRITDIQNNQVLWPTVPYCSIPKEDIDTYLLQPNDILFARTGGTVGKSFLVNEVPEPSIYAGYLIRTRYSNSLNPKYMKYFMESELYWTQLRDGTTSTAQPNCNGKTLSKMLVPLPPLSEQRRIVTKLEELLQEIDKLKA